MKALEHFALQPHFEKIVLNYFNKIEWPAKNYDALFLDSRDRNSSVVPAINEFAIRASRFMASNPESTLNDLLTDDESWSIEHFISIID